MQPGLTRVIKCKLRKIEPRIVAHNGLKCFAVKFSLNCGIFGTPVITNEDRLQQVLTILLDNAIKFTPAGGQIILGLEATNRGARFFVRDTGVGMDAETRRHCFDRFHQGDKSHRASGSGLGLAIAREIMTRLGARLTVRSELGEGSEFSFTLRQENQA